jgi:hypothetical protein
MKTLSVKSVALAATVAVGLPLAGAMAAGPMNEQHLDPKNAYQNALTDCEMLENPDRRQQCKDKAMQEYERAQKDMKDSNKEKAKQY